MSDGAGTHAVKFTACGKPFFQFLGDARYLQSIEDDLAERADCVGLSVDDYALGVVLNWPEAVSIRDEHEGADFRDALLHAVLSMCSRDADPVPLRELVGRVDLNFNVAIMPADGGEVFSVAFVGIGGRVN